MRAPVPIHASDSNEMTAIDDKMLARPLAIESSKPGRVGDDDPTMLSVREEDRRGKADGARGDRPSGKARALEPDRTYPEGSGAREAPQTEKDPSKIVPVQVTRGGSGEALRSRLPLVIVLVMVALAVLIGALFLGGVIRL